MDSHPAPRFREPHSSLAIGRRFRLLARAPLIGAGTVPRAVEGLHAVGRGGVGKQPESSYEKQLLLPDEGTTDPKVLVWAEARFTTDIAAEHALVLGMLLPTETAPERKKEAQRLHDRALKLWSRVDAMGPQGVGDPRSLASDLRSGLQPLLDFKAACERSQADGQLQGLAWPSLIAHMHRELATQLDRMDALAAGKGLPTPDVLAQEACRDTAQDVRFAAHLIDPLDGETVGRAFAIARRLDDAHHAGPAGVDEALADALAFQTDLARRVEQATLASILSPIWADHMRRETQKSIEDLRRSRGLTPTV